MKTTSTILTALGLMALASGCAVEGMEGPSEEVGTTEQGIMCNNELATDSVLAGMAVAAAKEMRRWLPGRDFECQSNNGWEIGSDYLPSGAPDGLADTPGKCIRWGSRWQMWTSPKGRARCPNSNCRNMHALLRLQEDNAAGMIFGGQPLDPGLLRTKLYSYWDRQFVCINRPDNGRGDDCPVELHDLAFSYKTQSSVTCDGGYDFWFHAYKMGTTTNLGAADAAQLKNMLLWAGHPNNAFLAFDTQGDDVKIDPVGGTADGSSTTSGSCTVVSYNASLNRCGSVYSATPLTGQCCTCNGVNKTFAPAAQIDYYKCQ